MPQSSIIYKTSGELIKRLGDFTELDLSALLKVHPKNELVAIAFTIEDLMSVLFGLRTNKTILHLACGKILLKDDKDIVFLADLFEANKTITKIDLNETPITEKGLKRLIDSVKDRNPSLVINHPGIKIYSILEFLSNKRNKRLILKDQIFNEYETKKLATYINNHGSLEEVIFDGCEFDSTGFRELAGALTNHPLRRFSLINKKLPEADFKALSTAMQNYRSLRYVNLNNNNFGPEGAVVIAPVLANKDLEIELDNNDLGDVGIEAIEKAITPEIRKQHSIQVIHLNGNKIGSNSAISLLKALVINHMPMSISLADNDLGPDAANILVALIRASDSLQALNLRGNRNLQKGDLEKIVKAVENNFSLIRFDLDIEDEELRKTLTGYLQRNAEHADKLVAATKSRNLEEISNLLSSSKSASHVRDGYSLLMQAVKVGKIEVVNALLPHRCNFLYRCTAEGSDKGKTALEIAWGLNQDDIANAIIKKMEEENYVIPVKEKALPSDEKATPVVAAAAPRVESETKSDGGAAANVLPAAAQAVSQQSAAPPTNLEENNSSALSPRSVRRRLETVETRVEVAEIKIEEHDRKLKRISEDTLAKISSNETVLEKVLKDKSSDMQYDDKLKIIQEKGNEQFEIYYLKLINQLSATWIACESISSTLVSNGSKKAGDYVEQGLLEVLEVVPGLKLVTKIAIGIIAGASKAQAVHDANHNIKAMTEFFSDPMTAFSSFKKLAIDLTLAQQAKIKSIKPSDSSCLIDQLKTKFYKAQDWFLADGSNDPVAVLAVSDGANLLQAIMKQELPHTNDVNQKLIHLKNRVLGNSPQQLFTPEQGVAPVVNPVVTVVPFVADPQPMDIKQMFQEFHQRQQVQEREQAALRKELEESKKQHQRLLEQDQVKDAALKKLQRELAAVKERVGESNVAGGDGQAQALVDRNPGGAASAEDNTKKINRLEEQIGLLANAHLQLQDHVRVSEQQQQEQPRRATRQ